MKSMKHSYNTYVETLYKPRHYNVGKVTGIGQARKSREIILDIKGKGVFKRLWTTHEHKTCVKIYIYVDDNPTPLLSGFAHELAQAAEKISCPQLPLGGYLNDKSVNIYIPIQFSKALRIEAEPIGETGDGPYWQIDYALDSDEQWPAVIQSDLKGKPQLKLNFPNPIKSETKELTTINQDIKLTSVSPHNIWVDGGGVIKKIIISGQDLDSLLLRISFDPQEEMGDRLDGPFQVDSPLKYLVGSFNNACVERCGSSAVIHFPMPFKTKAAIQLIAAVDCGSFSDVYKFNIHIEYETTPPESENFNYFYAKFKNEYTNGYDDFECCSIKGNGHFVGVHLFDTGHDHGGGDNIFFDAETLSAGQLHGICGEDYFHMAYMRIWNRTPFSGCPSHSERYRYHLEMPIPFKESFVFNWGAFASQPAKAVAFWYQETLSDSQEQDEELTYTITGPFDLSAIDQLSPDKKMPAISCVYPNRKTEKPVQSWNKKSQQSFIDLCHLHRKYIETFPFSYGTLATNIATCADTKIWVEHATEMTFILGCDDPIRLYLNNNMVFSDEGRTQANPFKAFNISVTLEKGINHIRVVVGNTKNTNWDWNGFSLNIKPKNKSDTFLRMI